MALSKWIRWLYFYGLGGSATMEYSYDNDNHRLYFLNKIISNLNSQFIDRFHGVTKRMLPLYYSEFEWRFNHRNCKSIMDKIKNYIMQSSIATRKMLRDSMDQYAMARGLENAWGCQMGTHILKYISLKHLFFHNVH